MLKRFKKKSAVDGDLLAFIENEHILRIWRNSTTSREDFNAVYIPPLYTVFSSVPSDEGKGYLSHLTHALLVARNGLVLGKHLPYEDAMRVKNAFAYALSMAPLLQTYAEAQCRKKNYSNVPAYALAMCQSFLGEVGYDWLRRNDTVYFNFLNYFVDPKASEIHDAIKRVIKSNPELDEKRREVQLGPILFSNLELAAGSTQAEPSGKDGFGNQAVDFILWFENAINSKLLSANVEDSLVHCLDNGDLFLLYPDCLNVYTRSEGGSERSLKKKLRLKKYLRSTGEVDLHYAEINGKEVKGLIIEAHNIKTDKALDVSEFVQL